MVNKQSSRNAKTRKFDASFLNDCISAMLFLITLLRDEKLQFDNVTVETNKDLCVKKVLGSSNDTIFVPQNQIVLSSIMLL